MPFHATPKTYSIFRVLETSDFKSMLIRGGEDKVTTDYD